MRLRNLKNKEEIIDSSTYLIKGPEDYLGQWSKLFLNDKPIHLEIGMGKGDFIYNMALKYPHINFIGIEKYTNIIARALKKYPRKLDNLYIINCDAKNLNTVFKEEIDTIYLNFSDPWPKKRQEKRRLTSPYFLDIYDKIFKDRKRIVMKTDNRELFSYSLVSLSQHGYILKDVSLDLQNKDIDNVLSEYEKKFVAQNILINYLEALK